MISPHIISMELDMIKLSDKLSKIKLDYSLMNDYIYGPCAL